MGAAALPVFLITAFWGVVGILFPIFVPKGPNRGILQLILILTAAVCWLFWLCCYMTQMNPLIGPRISNTTLILMKNAWSGVIS